MSDFVQTLKTNTSYGFMAVGAVWLVIALYISSALVIWPVATCVVSGLLLRLRPRERITWAWASSTAVLGALVSAYRAYIAIPFIFGAFQVVSAISIVGFGLFAVVHLFLLYAGNAAPEQAK
ncbi:MAG: hypothetical protein HY297_00795 [Thaumarchaeota archaeon]|nr:hypothetical protein [Nitrososphaerota archaeon]